MRIQRNIQTVKILESQLIRCSKKKNVLESSGTTFRSKHFKVQEEKKPNKAI